MPDVRSFGVLQGEQAADCKHLAIPTSFQSARIKVTASWPTSQVNVRQEQNAAAKPLLENLGSQAHVAQAGKINPSSFEDH
jgi:hypothetical protein